GPGGYILAGEVVLPPVIQGQAPEAIERAVAVLKGGGLVAFPTDTVYGVGAHAFLPQAVELLYVAKERPHSKAIPLLLTTPDDLPSVAKDIPPVAWLLIEKFWPGGLTLVLPKRSAVPPVVSAGGPTVAIRVPDHPLALSLIQVLEAPLAATSANLSGQPECLSAQAVLKELGPRVHLILDGGRCPGGIPSTVVDLTTHPPRILRHGAIPAEALTPLLPDLKLDNVKSSRRLEE
ncbi:MAG: L-threonylcarbamoyladenylate synthase, partial [Anaerolineae bacterium]